MINIAPCPYHDPARSDCGHTHHCPLFQYSEYVVCTTLTPTQILAVRTWVEGRAPDWEEAGT